MGSKRTIQKSFSNFKAFINANVEPVKMLLYEFERVPSGAAMELDCFLVL